MTRDEPDPIGEELRREASAATTPTFSPLLHARVMRTVAAPPPGRRWWPVALAAAVAAAVGIALLTRPAVTPPPVVVVKPPSLPSFHVDLVDLTRPAVQQLHDARYAYLDRDARTLVTFVSRHLDVLPPTR